MNCPAQDVPMKWNGADKDVNPTIGDVSDSKMSKNNQQSVQIIAKTHSVVRTKSL